MTAGDEPGSERAGAIGGSAPDLSADLEVAAPPEPTAGSGTRPEGNTRRDGADARPGHSVSRGDPLIGRVILDRFRIERRIGAGGMGAVYVGTQLVVNREVALKVLRADLLSNEHVRKRFRREAGIIGQLSHAHTIHLIDYGETEDGLAVMVTELLRGTPLNERLSDEGPMSLSEVLDLGEQVANSLSEAHAKGLVHRDLKPANIFLVGDGSERLFAKVLDFGIARIMDEEATRLTSDGQVFGTPRYMSPEQAVSTAEVDARSDIYSLGLILYEALVGQPPFVAQTSLQYLSAHTTQAPPKLRERFPAAPGRLEALIDACLDKSATARPESARALAAELVAIRRELEGSLPPGLNTADLTEGHIGGATTGWRDAGTRSGPVTELPRPGRKASLPILAAVFAVLVVGGGAAWAWMQRHSAPVVIATVADSGPVAMVVDAGPPDLGARDAGVTAPVVEAVDAGSAEDDRSGRRTRRSDRTRRTRPDAGTEAPKDTQSDKPGANVVDGPRILNLKDSNFEDTTVDLRDLAASCGRRSVFSGPARLSTSGCPSGCTVVVDEQCAGVTPAEGRGLPVGRHRVAVVCDGKIRAERRVQVSAFSPATVACD